MFIVCLKKRNIHRRYTEKNIRLSRYSGIKSVAQHTNIYIFAQSSHLYIYIFMGSNRIAKKNLWNIHFLDTNIIMRSIFVAINLSRSSSSKIGLKICGVQCGDNWSSTSSVYCHDDNCQNNLATHYVLKRN